MFRLNSSPAESVYHWNVLWAVLASAGIHLFLITLPIGGSSSGEPLPANAATAWLDGPAVPAANSKSIKQPSLTDLSTGDRKAHDPSTLSYSDNRSPQPKNQAIEIEPAPTYLNLDGTGVGKANSAQARLGGVVLPPRDGPVIEASGDDPLRQGGSSGYDGLGGAGGIPPPVQGEGEKTQFSIEEGTVPPELVTQENPVLTPEARRQGFRGSVLLRGVVLEDGRLEGLSAPKPVGYGLEEAAIRTVMAKWKFKPALIKGKPVAFVITFSVNFRDR